MDILEYFHQTPQLLSIPDFMKLFLKQYNRLACSVFFKGVEAHVALNHGQHSPRDRKLPVAQKLDRQEK